VVLKENLQLLRLGRHLAERNLCRKLLDDALALGVLALEDHLLGDLALQFLLASLDCLDNDDAVCEDLLLAGSCLLRIRLHLLRLGLASGRLGE
jgi:hypothetical protein